MHTPLPERAHALLSGQDGAYSPWATACSIAMYAMNAGYTEEEFIRLVSESHFAYEFATENGRDRSNRLELRLSRVWARVENGWCPPISDRNDVRQRLEALSQRIADHRWSGQTASKDRAVALALVAWGHEIGTWTVDAGTRELALRAGVAQGTAKRALSRLADRGLIERDRHAARQRTHAQRWVLDLDWRLSDNLDPHDLATGGKGLCGSNLSISQTPYLNPAQSHPAFLGSALGQTAERVWLDLSKQPDSTAAEIADRLGTTARTVNRALDTKLIPHRLVSTSGARSGKGRPAPTFCLDPQAPSLDEIAETFGVLDWHDRTLVRHERERAGYREVQRQIYERTKANTDAEWLAAIERLDRLRQPALTERSPVDSDPFAEAAS